MSPSLACLDDSTISALPAPQRGRHEMPTTCEAGSSSPREAARSNQADPLPPKRGELEYRTSQHSIHARASPNEPSPRAEERPLPPPFSSTAPPSSSLLAPPLRRPFFVFLLRLFLILLTTTAWLVIALVPFHRDLRARGAEPWVLVLFSLGVVAEGVYAWRAGRRVYALSKRARGGTNEDGRATRWIEKWVLWLKPDDLRPLLLPRAGTPAPRMMPVYETASAGAHARVMTMREAAGLCRATRGSVAPSCTFRSFLQQEDEYDADRGPEGADDSPEMRSSPVLDQGPPPDPVAASSSRAVPASSCSASPSSSHSHIRRRSSVALTVSLASNSNANPASNDSHDRDHLRSPSPAYFPPLSPTPSSLSFSTTSNEHLLPLPALTRQSSIASFASGASATSGTSRWELLRSARERDERWDGCRGGGGRVT
ncbi:hypothetical protein JCM1840_007647 [Sporobolomyces johnsonii]